MAFGHKYLHGHNTEVNMYPAVINFKPMTSTTFYVAYIMPRKKAFSVSRSSKTAYRLYWSIPSVVLMHGVRFIFVLIDFLIYHSDKHKKVCYVYLPWYNSIDIVQTSWCPNLESFESNSEYIWSLMNYKMIPCFDMVGASAQ